MILNKKMLEDVSIGNKKAFTWESFELFVKPWAEMARILMLKFSQDPFFTQNCFDEICDAWKEACQDVYNDLDHLSLNNRLLHLRGFTRMSNFYKSEQINNLFIVIKYSNAS